MKRIISLLLLLVVCPNIQVWGGGKRLTSTEEMRKLINEYETRISQLESNIKAIKGDIPKSQLSQYKKAAIKSFKDAIDKIKAEKLLLLPNHLSEHLRCQQSDGKMSKPIYNLDLSKQFPPTYKQRFGNCWSYAGTSLVEAALTRSTGKVHSFSPEYQSVCTILDNDLDDNRTQKLIDHFKENGTDYTDVPNIVDGHWSHTAIDHMLNSGKVCTDFKAFERRMNTLNKIHCLAGNSTAGIQAQIDNQNFFVKSMIKVNCSADLQAYLKKSTDNILRRFEAAGYVQTINFTGFKRHSIDLQHDHDITSVKSSYDLEKNEFKKGTCNPSNSKVRNSIKQLMDTLCQGHPLAVGVYLNGVEMSNDGGEKFEKYKGKKHGFHAMNIQGIEYDDQGKPYFSLRNSWKSGNEKLKDMSIARIPIDEVCRILDVQYITTSQESNNGEVQRKNELQTIQYHDY